MWRLVCLLTLAEIGFAQPVYGPYTVWTAPPDSQIQGTELCSDVDAANLFFGVGGAHLRPHQMKHLQCSLENPPSILVEENLFEPSEWTWNFDDAASVGNRWFVAMTGWSHLYGNQQPLGANHVDLCQGNEGLDSCVTMFYGYEAPVGCGGKLTGGRFCILEDSSLGFTGYDYDCWDGGSWSEPAQVLMGKSIYPQSSYWMEVDLGMWSWHGAGTMMSPDSCFFVCDYWDQTLVVPFGVSWGEPFALFANCLSTFTPKYLYFLDDSNFVAALYSAPYDFTAPLQSLLYRVTRDGSCSEFAHSSLGRIDDLFFHPSYGFAAIEVHPSRLLLARIDTSGQAVHPVGVLHEFDGTSHPIECDVTITDDGKVVAVWSEIAEGESAPRTVKLAWVHWSTYLGADDLPPSIPTSLSLSAFPNPFNSDVTIEYELPKAGEVKLELFDLNGRTVETLIAEKQIAGTHKETWSPRDIPSGVYFARLSASSSQKTAKLLFIK